MPPRSRIALFGVLGLALGGFLVYEFGLWLALLDTGDYERGKVTVHDETGERLGWVEVRIADTPNQRTVGLGRTAALGPNEGMFFVHDGEGRYGYVMRGMAFPLDIVFVDANGTITRIHHADPAAPWTPVSLLERYPGEGKYVLEVERGWTNETGVEVGDRVDGPDAVGPGGGQPSATPDGTGREPTPSATPSGPTVTTVDRNGTALATVRVRIADDASERYTGLSETPSLGPDEGMLFVFEREATRAFVMRDMSFPLDMVFVGANGTVTEIHHASLPPPGTEESELRRYRATARYVLEVDRGWTNETALDEGDAVRVPAGY